MRSIDVLAALLNEETGRIEVVKEITNDDGSVEFAGQDFHPETLEWWAAVYDTNDIDELIELLVLEPHLDNVNPVEMSASDARAAQRQMLAGFKAKHQKVVRTKGTAKAILQQSVLPAKYANAAEEDPFQVIKRHCPIDPEIIAIKKRHVERIRQANNLTAKRAMPDRREMLLRSERQLEAIRGTNQKESKGAQSSRVLPTIELGKGRKRTK